MTAQRRLNTLLLSIFGVVAALLAAVGIYGVIAYSVEQRTRELGVRIALGAPAGRILRLVATEVVSLAVAGLVIGLGRGGDARALDDDAAVPGERDRSSHVRDHRHRRAADRDRGQCVPALRAVRVDPVKALRAE